MLTAATSRFRGPVDEMQDVGPGLVERDRASRPPGSEEIPARRDAGGMFSQHSLHATPQPVALNGASGPTADSESHPRVLEGLIWGEQHPQRAPTGTAPATQGNEVGTVTTAFDQALRR